MPDSDISPVSLTDIQMDAVLAAAHPLAPDRRSAFLAEVARTLASERVIGDGLLHRVIMHVQRQYFDPPDLGRTTARANIADGLAPRGSRADAGAVRFTARRSAQEPKGPATAASA